MARTLCVWYPEWPLRRPGVPRDEPAQAVGEGNFVEAANAAARSAGVQRGMRRGEAEGICPLVVTVERDPSAEMIAFEQVVRAVEDLIPKVEVVEPGLVFAPVAGAVGYYGGEAQLVERIVKEIDRVAGPGFLVGLADGPFAAKHAASAAHGDPPVLIVEDDAAFLASLDIAAVGREELVATFRWLGITTLGALARLPGSAIASRFGTEGLDAHRLATGRDRTVRPRIIPEELAVAKRFVPPLEDLDQASFAARTMAARLIEALAEAGTAPYQIVVEAEAADGTTRSRTWRSADPLDDRAIADRVRWQLRAWIEGVGAGIRGGLAALRIEPADLSGAGRQLAIGEDSRVAEEAERAFSEAQAIVGRDGLLQAQPQGGREPRDRVAWHRWGEEPTRRRDPDAPWIGRIPAPSPALVPPEPRPLHVDWDGGMPVRVRLGSRWVTVRSWAGPWRRVGRWWRGEEPTDQYQIVTSAGAFLCEIREGSTWLTGIYD
ncbi:MAG: DNA polymerase Y family protein [Actinomycetota bacterium]